MLDMNTQEKLLNSYITAAEVAELVGLTKDPVYKKLIRLLPDQEKKGLTTFFFREDVNKLYDCISYKVIDKEQARREVLTIGEASKLTGRAVPTLHRLVDSGAFLTAKHGKTVLITLSSLVSYYKPSYSTRTDKLLSPLVAKHLQDEHPNIYAYIEKKTFKLKVTDSNSELDNALYSLYLAPYIDKNISYTARMELLKSTIDNWITEVFEDLYNRFYAR